MNLNEMKNDAARKSAIRARIAQIVSEALIAEFGDTEVVNVPNKITVHDSDISGDTVAVRVGMVTVDGDDVDVVATVSATVKAWKTSTNKSGRVTNAVTLDDIADEVEMDAEIRAEEKAKKAKK